MSLPFELTTLPKGALDIIRFLHTQDAYSAFDDDIINITGLSDRGFGKAIRRLVTKEYVEMQYDGPYLLTHKGIDAAETIAAEDEAGMADSSFEPDSGPSEPEPPALETVLRSAVVITPKLYTTGQPGFLFVRVEEAAAGQDGMAPVDVLFRVAGDCRVFPDQDDTHVPEQEPAAPVRFELTPVNSGAFTVRIEAYHITRSDMIPAGAVDLAFTADDVPPAQTFKKQAFDLTLQPGL